MRGRGKGCNIIQASSVSSASDLFDLRRLKKIEVEGRIGEKILAALNDASVWRSSMSATVSGVSSSGANTEGRFEKIGEEGRDGEDMSAASNDPGVGRLSVFLRCVASVASLLALALECRSRFTLINAVTSDLCLVKCS